MSRKALQPHVEFQEAAERQQGFVQPQSPLMSMGSSITGRGDHEYIEQLHGFGNPGGVFLDSDSEGERAR